MGMESKFIWMNGELLPYERAKLHILTPALHYGAAVFEGIRAYGTDKGRPDCPRSQRLLKGFQHRKGSHHTVRAANPSLRSRVPAAHRSCRRCGGT